VGTLVPGRILATSPFEHPDVSLITVVTLVVVTVVTGGVPLVDVSDEVVVEVGVG